MKKNKFSQGWNEDRVRDVLAHYEAQTEEEAMAEDEAAWEDSSGTFIEVPTSFCRASANYWRRRRSDCDRGDGGEAERRRST